MSEETNSYAGRWVARLRGKIVAQGGTPDQARRAAQSRFKEAPEISFVPLSEAMVLPPIVEAVRAVIPQGVKVYLVGGAVRDILLGRSTHDLDFTLEREAIPLARRVANSLKTDFYPLDTERDTGRVVVSIPDGERTFLDFAAYRGPSLEDDLTGRDFTLNAVAMDMVDHSLLDPLGGMIDLQEKKLRLCSPTALLDDSVRILRGIRLAACFGFHLVPETREKMKAAAASLVKVSSERLRDELFRILDGPQPAACLRSLERLGALDYILPELPALKGAAQRLPHVSDVWEHTLSAVNHLESLLAALAPTYEMDKASDWFHDLMVVRIGRFRQALGDHLSTELIPGRTVRSLLFLAATYHDVAKPETKTIDEKSQLHFFGHDQMGAQAVVRRARALMLSNEETKRLETIIANHMRIHFLTNRLLSEGKPPSRRAIYKFFRQTGPAGVDICLLTLADLRATYEETLPQETWSACLDVVRTLLEAWFEKREETVWPALLLDGNDLQKELDLQPGPLIGQLIESIREAQAVGEVSTREEALALAKKKLSER